MKNGLLYTARLLIGAIIITLCVLAISSPLVKFDYIENNDFSVFCGELFEKIASLFG